MDESVLWSWRLLSPIRGGSEPHCSGVVREFRLMPNRIIDRCLVLDTLESTRGGQFHPDFGPTVSAGNGKRKRAGNRDVRSRGFVEDEGVESRERVCRRHFG